MILRRITQHIKDQNWFAVGIDFFIVVIGVFIGIQVANWNETRAEQLSEAQYLERLAEEVHLTLDHIEKERAFGEESIAVIERFASDLFADDVSDEILLSSTREFFTKGILFLDFKPVRTTFDDLTATGNLDIIADPEIRSKLVVLYSDYDEATKTVETNISWIQEGEAQFFYEFDVMRFDQRTQALFNPISVAEQIQDIKRDKSLMRRQAAFHYWIKDRTLELYDEVEPQAAEVLALLETELNK